MLNKAFFQHVRNNHRQIIIKLELGHQIALSVTVQQPAKAGDKQVALLRHNLREPMSLLLEPSDFHLWQLDPVLECPRISLAALLLQHEDSQFHHGVLAAGRSKRAIHAKQLHNVTGVDSRWQHVAEGLCKLKQQGTQHN
jgi:hypothetical protein